MPVKSPSHRSAVCSPRRQKLAFWLMMGCTSPTLLAASLPCTAGELERVGGAAEGEHVEIRVPSFRPTATVHSVLGLLPGEYNDPVGTSIQLLPPTTPPASAPPASAPPAASPPPAAEQSAPAAAVESGTTITSNAITSTPTPTPTAILVTRENAKLGAPQRSWQAEVPSFQPPAPHTEKNAIMAANRSEFPAWIEPETPSVVTAPPATDEVDPSQGVWRPRGETNQPEALRDPAPALLSPTLSSPALSSPALSSAQSQPAPFTAVSPPSKSVGSGLPKLAPVETMPALDASPAWVEQADPLPALDELPDHANADSSAQAIANATNPHDGNNEGDATGPVEIDDWDGMAMHEPDEATGSPSALSTIDIQPFVMDPAEALPPSTDIAGSRAAQDRAGNTDKNPPVSKIPTAKPAVTSTTKRDATGRVKTHDGVGAVENLDPRIARMQQPILQTLRSFHAQTEQADSRSNWGMMHAIMIYGVDTRIIARRRNYSAIAWMAGNNVCRGNRMMTTHNGQIKAREGTGLQGHQAQWLATLSLASVPANYPLYADNQKFTIEDLVHVEAAACEEGKELTFTLIGLSHYLDTDATWAGVDGEPWDFERLIAAELDEPIVGAACGGTHRLMGFAHALRKRRLEGKPITGQWNRAETFLNDFVQYTYTLQNRDGSFSTDWFESPQDNGELSRKVQTTGHILEFLLTHLPDEELVNDKVFAAVRFLNSSIRRVKIDDAGVGYRAHALRSLAMYHQRVYGIAPAYPPGQMAFGQYRNQHHR